VILLRRKYAFWLACIVLLEIIIFIFMPVPKFDRNSKALPSADWKISAMYNQTHRYDGKHFIDYEAQEDRTQKFGIIIFATIITGGVIIFSHPKEEG
jgi:hypothetical protein